ncbi:MAG: hypothetical protein VW297_13385 [Paracoccaceae bacterium]
MSLYKRIIGFWALLLLGACGFEPVYAPSTSTNSVRNNFDLSAPTDRGTYQFYHNLKGQISDNPQAQYALSHIPSPKARPTLRQMRMENLTEGY